MVAIITWDNTRQKAANMKRLSKRVGTQHLAKWSRRVAETGKESVKYMVLSGGENKTKKTGPRILSGQMFDSIEERQKLRSGHATVTAGFDVGSGTPKWTKWQEGGTPPRAGNSGIPAMLAIPEAIRNMEAEIDNSGMRMLGAIATEWNSV